MKTASRAPLCLRLFALVAAASCASASYTLMGFGSADANDIRCSVLGTGAIAGCSTQGQCSVCAPEVLLDNVTMACSGDLHSVAVLANGSVAVTGVSAALGMGGTADAASCTDSWAVLDWTVANDAANVSSVTCGANYTLLLTSNGTVFAFGTNQGGVFGDDASNVPHFAVPTALDFSIDAPVATIAAGLEAAVFGLHNGSVMVTGSGALRTGATSASGVAAAEVAMPAGCVASDKLSVGLESAVMVCADNASFVGWGDNSRNQLENNTANVTAIANITDNLANIDASVYISAVSVSPTHLVVLLSNGTAYGRGSNAEGQLALGVSVPSTEMFEQIPFTNGPAASNAISVLQAGRGTTAVISTLHVMLAGGAYSNFFTVGSNAGCGLGLGDASTAQTHDLQAVHIGRLTNYRARMVQVNDFRRTMALVEMVSTLTPTMSVSESESSSRPTRTGSPSPSDSESSSSTLTASASGSDSGLTPSDEVTASVHRVSKTSSRSLPPTKSKAGTMSVSVSLEIAAAPRLVDAIYSRARSLLTIVFDVATNRPGAGSDGTSVPASSLRELIAVTGARQIVFLGNAAWVSDRELAVVAEVVSGGNITFGVARVELLPTFTVLRRNVTSSSTPVGSSVPIQRPVLESAVGSGGETNRLPTWLPIVLGVFAALLITAYIVAFIVYMLRRRKQRAVAEDAKRRDQERHFEMRESRRPDSRYAIDGVVDKAAEDEARARAEADARAREETASQAMLREMRTSYGEHRSVDRSGPAPSPPRSGRSGMIVGVPRDDSSSPEQSRSPPRNVPPPTDDSRFRPSWTSRREFEDDPSLANYGAMPAGASPSYDLGHRSGRAPFTPVSRRHPSDRSVPSQPGFSSRLRPASQVVDSERDRPSRSGVRIDVERSNIDTSANVTGAAAPVYASQSNVSSSGRPRVFRLDHSRMNSSREPYQ